MAELVYAAELMDAIRELAADKARRENLITMVVGKHGQFQTSAGSLDSLMERYLPASPTQLRAVIAQRSEIVDYDDLTTITECLMVLAELDGLATN